MSEKKKAKEAQTEGRKGRRKEGSTSPLKGSVYYFCQLDQVTFMPCHG